MLQSRNWPVLVVCFENSKFADLANCRCVNFIYSDVPLKSNSVYILESLVGVESLIKLMVFWARLIKCVTGPHALASVNLFSASSFQGSGASQASIPVQHHNTMNEGYKSRQPLELLHHT